MEEINDRETMLCELELRTGVPVEFGTRVGEMEFPVDELGICVGDPRDNIRDVLLGRLYV